MKIKILFIAFAMLLLSCQVEGDLTKSSENFNSDPIETTQLLAEGTFMPTSGINVSGNVKIYLDENNLKKLQLENFSISSGPDLKVYLSKSNSPSEFVNLGALTNATIYSIPESVNLSQYNHVLIHCQQYNHLFAIASLTNN